MNNYKLTISYDGSRYKGWQSQKTTEDTISGRLQQVLEKYTTESVKIIGAGRTDGGVHALGQVANVHLQQTYPEAILKNELNTFLPEDIKILSLEKVDERFHSRFLATKKHYQYRICISDKPDVFSRKYVYHFSEKVATQLNLSGQLNIEEMRSAAKLLSGEHDFTSFCSNGKMKKSAVRQLYAINITGNSEEIYLDFIGEGFLQNMIRIITGTLIEVGAGAKQKEEMQSILAAKKRAAAGYTVPPQGLTLISVDYE